MADGMDIAERRDAPAKGEVVGDKPRTGDTRMDDTRAGDTRAGDTRMDETRTEPPREDARQSRRDAPAQDSGKGGDGGTKPKKRRRGLVFLIVFLVVAALIAGGVYYWLSTRNIESTDDAYTDGYVVSVAPQVSGQVTVLAVRDNQFVHAGDVLVQIDPRTFQAAVDQAKANLENAEGQLVAAKFASEIARKNYPATLLQAQAQLASAEAQLFKAQTDAHRQHALPKAATTQQDIDTADAALMQAQAQVKLAEAQVQQAAPVQQNIGQTDARVTQLDGGVAQAKAQLEQAELNLEWATVRAPQDGWVTKRSVNQGDYLTAGQALMSLVTPQVWVTANFKETQLDRMRPGQKVDFEVDAYPSLTLHGHVDSVQLGSGSRFTAFPAENATGNYVKIVQRVPVKLVIDSGLDPNLPLPLGISVVPTVRLKAD
jgi:membrane fusion protein (multidrug efflux system)